MTITCKMRVGGRPATLKKVVPLENLETHIAVLVMQCLDILKGLATLAQCGGEAGP